MVKYIRVLLALNVLMWAGFTAYLGYNGCLGLAWACFGMSLLSVHTWRGVELMIEEWVDL